MYKHRELTEKRIGQRIAEVSELIYGPTAQVAVEAFEVTGEPISVEVAVKQAYTPFAVGDVWGTQWGTVWFRISGTIPTGWSGREVVALIDLGSLSGEGFSVEGLVWRDGLPLTAVNVNRMDVPIGKAVTAGEEFEFYVEAAANPSAAVNGKTDLVMPDPDGPRLFKLRKAELACFNRDVFDAYHDLKCTNDAMLTLDVASARRGQLLYALNQAIDAIEIGDAESVKVAGAAIRPMLHRRNGDTVHQLSAIGHAHIDTAWLWPLRETIRKCARTFSTALAYMDEYPDYVFACSQPQQYAWMKEYYPHIFSGIKDAVRRGQWEPIGSMWIEADCNLSSGESLVRQILYGKKFFRDEFGVDTVDVWIPDVFGYSASMPQIMEKSGIQYFLTQKISWNQFNKFPHHTFLWEGIDGTRIFTHFPPADTYIGAFSASELTFNVSNFKEHDRAARSLYVYGFGDGGGGPTKGMLEAARRYENCEGLPQVQLEKVRDFFVKAKADARDLPVWVGELYLELHRGTYTTQARTKRGNRKNEFLLRDAEFFDAITSGAGNAYSYAPRDLQRAVYDVTGKHDGPRTPQGDMERAWKLLLLNQFHDIIPGSSIHWVYSDNARDHQTIADLANGVINAARPALLQGIDTRGLREPVIAINTLAQARSEVVALPNGNLAYVEAPSCGYAVQDAVETRRPAGIADVTVQQESGGCILENGLLRVIIDGDGLISSIIDLQHDREAVEPGQRANLLQLHPDRPTDWDAWDVDIYYREQCQDITDLESLSVLETGPLRASVEIVRKFGDSQIKQCVKMTAGSYRIDFETEVDWRESHKFLKAAFPVKVRSARATFEIQYGHTERPTHYNTSWDLARFEVCAQKWADLSEPGYGVALLNDCKYGYDIHGNVMRLSLLRSPTAPDPEADRGFHQFTYSILPHAGDIREGRVIEQAYALNCPMHVVTTPAQTGAKPLVDSFVAIDRPGVFVESLKRAEDGDGVIVRLYEGYGSRGPATVTTGLPIKRVERTDLLENTIERITMHNGAVPLMLEPFEIVTLRLIA